jgi:tetratricopeptide (TPR) repeat protein
MNLPEQLMEEGWKARENLDFNKAEKLLIEAKEMFEKVGDWFNVTEALNHLAYTEKLKAIHHNLKGMAYAKEAKRISEGHSTRKELVLRALMSLANSSGLYEQALRWGKECLKYFPGSASRADILSHIATFQLRTGYLAEAEKTINEAELLIDQGYEQEREPHRSIWKSKVLFTKALILFNKNTVREAKEYADRAYQIAKEQDLKTRQKEIQEIMELFDGNSLT